MKQGWEAGHEAWGIRERSAGRHVAKGATQPVRPVPSLALSLRPQTLNQGRCTRLCGVRPGDWSTLALTL